MGRRAPWGLAWWRTATVLTGWALFAGACSHAPPPEPLPPLGPLCPNSTLVRGADPRPVRLAVENRTSERMRIVLDRCLHHTRLGWVGPGRTAYLRLPDRLVRFGDGLRLHVYVEEPTRRFGTFSAGLGTPLARLVIHPDSAGGHQPRR